MRIFFDILAGIFGAAVGLIILFASLAWPAYQTLISALIALVATIIAAAIAWVAVQRQIKEQRRQNYVAELSQLNRYRQFMADLAEELGAYRGQLGPALLVFKGREREADALLNCAQHIPYSIPSYSEPLISYKARLSLDALNSLLMQYERFLGSEIDKNGLPLDVFKFSDETKQRCDRILLGCDRTSNQLLEDIAEIDWTETDDRMSQLAAAI
ncbi:hypothetical protein LP7551_02085 [Roseibium album]|nr:hypothetical protein LP7551_02085 [Roseibium album]